MQLIDAAAGGALPPSVVAKCFECAIVLLFEVSFASVYAQADMPGRTLCAGSLMRPSVVSGSERQTIP
jgi:hypothetical protein